MVKMFPSLSLVTHWQDHRSARSARLSAVPFFRPIRPDVTSQRSHPCGELALLCLLQLKKPKCFLISEEDSGLKWRWIQCYKDIQSESDEAEDLMTQINDAVDVFILTNYGLLMALVYIVCFQASVGGKSPAALMFCSAASKPGWT